ncbi:hypothetical protein ACE6H2_010183 [Prunus campanulata]
MWVIMGKYKLIGYALHFQLILSSQTSTTTQVNTQQPQNSETHIVEKENKSNFRKSKTYVKHRSKTHVSKTSYTLNSHTKLH